MNPSRKPLSRDGVVMRMTHLTGTRHLPAHLAKPLSVSMLDDMLALLKYR